MCVPLLVLLSASCIVAYQGESLSHYDLQSAPDYFSWFVKTFNKQYSSAAEEKKRFEIFTKFLAEVNENNNAHGGKPVYGITRFSDLTTEEFLKMYTGLKFSKDIDTVCEKAPVNITNEYPDEFDWRTKNVVTQVKNQGTCGSCWAFGATGNIEGQYARLTSELVSLSEQQLVDCDKASDACNGGLPDLAMSYLIQSGGQLQETDYPYKGKQYECSADKSKALVKISKCVSYDTNDEDQLRKLLYLIGPLSIAVDAQSFIGYNGGVIRNCKYEALNHAVLLVGYGTENGDPYWLIKNSWGEGWGEQGYVKVKRGENPCGMMEYWAHTVHIDA